MTEPLRLRVIAGGLPTDEETAALVAVLTAAVQDTTQAPDDGRTGGGWRRSGREAASWQRAGWTVTARRAALRRQQ